MFKLNRIYKKQEVLLFLKILMKNLHRPIIFFNNYFPPYLDKLIKKVEPISLQKKRTWFSSSIKLLPEIHSCKNRRGCSCFRIDYH